MKPAFIYPDDYGASADALLWAQELSGLVGPIRGWGEPSLLLASRVAIIGSRAAEGWGLAALEAIATGVSAAGRVVVSGGAVGSDCVAHRASLAAGGSTIVVLPGPLEDIDLRTWRREWQIPWDQKRVLFLSPFPPGERPRRSHPIIRNRLVAALGHATVAGVTGLTSGTNHTISEVNRLSRPLFVLDTRSDEEQLRLAIRTLASGGARLFTAEEALAPAFHAEIAKAAMRQSQRDGLDSGSQMRFFEPPARYESDLESELEPS